MNAASRTDVMMHSLLTFLSNRRRDGKSWSVLSVKSKRAEHVAILQAAVTRSLRMGLVEMSGGYSRITARGSARIKRK